MSPAAQVQTAPKGKGFAGCLHLVGPLFEDAKSRVRLAANRLALRYAHVPFQVEGIEEMLASSLDGQLLAMMSRTLVLELNVARLEGLLTGATAEQRFESFVYRLQEPEIAEQFFGEYSVLRDQLTTKLDRWAAFSIEFLEHLCEDFEDIQSSLLGGDPGTIVKINGGAGDTHRHGRSVMVALFSGGKTLVYKPRPLDVDEHFQQLLEWFNSMGAEPQFRTIKLLNRKNHGWSEFIRQVGCDSEADLDRFYQRQGAYLAILYALNASDFHYENLVAQGEHPFLIDLEALFHQRLEIQLPAMEDAAVVALADSVIRIGLLPMRLGMTDEYAGIDVSGLTNPAGQLSPQAMPQLDRMNTDEMRIVRKRAEMTGGANCPTLNGREAKAIEHADAIAEGFRRMYRLILQRRDSLRSALSMFAKDEIRFIPRPSQTYGVLLAESYHPDLLRDVGDRKALFERLGEASADRPSLNLLLNAECDDLLQGDIPLFTTRPDSCDLFTSRGDAIADFFPEPASSLAQRQLDGLSEEDLDRQLWIIRASLATLATSTSSGNRAAPTSAANFYEAARAIGDQLAKMAVTGSTGANWLGIAGANDGQRYVSPLGIDLYDGLPGVVYFLTYLGAVSGDARYMELAKSGLKTLLKQVDTYENWGGIGAFSGWSGVVYVLSHAAAVLNDPSLLDAAEGVVDRIAMGIPLDKDFDMVGGAAGCAVAMESLWRLRPSSKIQGIRRACGERMLETAQTNSSGAGWLCAGATDRPLTGFAHGNAGIAYSLLATAQATNDGRFAEMAVSALNYERALFSADDGNWQDLRFFPDLQFGHAWCHGAPGIALARLNSLRHCDNPTLRNELEIGLTTTLSKGFRGSQILCHGALGNADILLHASEVLGEPIWRQRATDAAQVVLKNAKESGWACDQPLGLQTPGLMTGLAGIGYGLLRLTDPSQVPCVLSLEPPREQL